MWRNYLLVCILGAVLANHADHANAAETAPEAKTEARGVALVIGNEDYGIDPLASPVNDARAVAGILADRGFDVMRYENATHAQIRDALAAFRRRLDDGGAAVFYFAGHGFQSSGETLLAATDADSRSPRSLIANSIRLQEVLDSMSMPRPDKFNLVILDSCLDSPFGAQAASDIAAPEDTLISLATAPGTQSWDGGRHGVFTAELLRAMSLPGLDIRQVLQHVASAVRQKSGGTQVPQVLSNVAVDALPMKAFGPLAVPLTATETIEVLRPRAILPKDSAEQYELAFWDSIKDSNHAADYEAYLQAYPKGRFASLAKARIERLRAAAPKTEAPASKAPERTKPQPPPKAATERPKPAPKEAPAASRPEPAEKEVPKKVESATPPATARSSGGGVSEIRDCPTCPVLVSLPGGSYTMGTNGGDPSEKPAHRVSISTPFAIGKHEVTVEQWNACVDGGGCPRVGSGLPGTTPIRDISWDDVQQYLKWLSKSTGKSYRLPSEAEWEYAARAGTTSRFWWGEQMRPGHANCKDCGDPWSQDGPANVGSFAANAFGLYDVSGSVWEWTSDCWHPSFKGAPDNGKSWEAPNCRERVIRGGSWRDGVSYMPVTTRFKYSASVRYSQNGFRVARDVK